MSCALTLLLRQRKGHAVKKSLRSRLVRSAAEGQDVMLEEARMAAEAAKLELEAARLRLEAEALERANAKERRAMRARELLGDSTLSTASPEELRTRLKETSGNDVSLERMQWVVKTVRPDKSEEGLRYEDLASDTFDSALEQVLAQEQEAKRIAQAQERERQRQEAEKRRQEQPVFQSRSMTEENDERTMGTRIISCFAYLLPLIDGLQYGFPLMALVPSLAPFFGLLAIPNAIINAIPFGSLIIFIALTALANNREFPRLLRFNLQQAVLLDVFLFIPSIIASLASIAMGGGSGMGPEIAIGIFIVLVIAVIYSVVCTLLGLDPDGIPFVSDATKRSIDGPFN